MKRIIMAAALLGLGACSGEAEAPKAAATPATLPPGSYEVTSLKALPSWRGFSPI